jgi:CRISPR-associated protein Csb3
MATGAVLATREILHRLRTAKPDFVATDDGLENTILPAVIPYGPTTLELDWWLDEFRAKAIELKCWAGQVTTRNLFTELLPLLDPACEADTLFESARMTKAKFGVDPRSAWNALSFGFSPNEHSMDAATYPAVEILAAVGLQTFRPEVTRRDGARRVRYALWESPLPAMVARQAFRSPWDGLRARTHEFTIASRGQSYKYFTFAKEEQGH